MSTLLQEHYKTLSRSTKWRKRYIANLIAATKSKQWSIRSEDSRQRILSTLENNIKCLIKDSPALQFTPLIKQARHIISLYRT